jgi:hypothetical protein
VSDYFHEIGGKKEDIEKLVSKLSNEQKKDISKTLSNNIDESFSIEDEKYIIKLFDTTELSLVTDSCNPSEKELKIMDKIYKKTDEIKNVLVKRGKNIVGEELLKYSDIDKRVINQALRKTASDCAIGSPVSFEEKINEELELFKNSALGQLISRK